MRLLVITITCFAVFALINVSKQLRKSSQHDALRLHTMTKEEEDNYKADVRESMDRILYEFDYANYTHALFAKIRRFPGNKWEFIEPTGSLRALFEGETGHMRIEYGFVGLEPLCYSQYCKIDFYTGTSCANGTQDEVGVDLWNDKKLDKNPWEHKGFYYSYKGHSMGEFYIDAGYNYYNYIGHIVVVSSLGGEKIGCGVLTPTTFKDGKMGETN